MILHSLRRALIAATLSTFVASACAEAELMLSVSNFTSTTITLTISGTFDANTTGNHSGWLAIKNDWVNNLGVHTEWFTNTPTVSNCSLVIGSMTYANSTVRAIFKRIPK
jgi:hypothetical protein